MNEEENEQTPQKNNNQALQENNQQIQQEKVQGAKDSANLAKNITTGNALGAAKDAKNIIKNKAFMKAILIKIALPIISIVLFIIIIASVVLGIFDAVGDAVQSAIGSIDEFFTIDYDNYGVIKISDEAIDKIIESIESTGLSLDDLKLMGDAVGKNDPEAEEKNKEALRKYIRQFYEAQAVTQTLYTNPSWYERVPGATYGTVYVQRTNSNDEDLSNVEQLEYISYEKMQEQISKGDLSVKQKFSVDENDKLVVVNSTQTVIKKDGKEIKNEVILGMNHIDYKTAISQYTTSMNFLLYLAVITQNPEFAAAVSDLVKNSDIRITLMDNVNTNITREEREYVLHTKTKTSVKDTDEEGNETGTSHIETSYSTQNKTETTETTVITTTALPAVTYAKTWFSEQTITYNKKETSVEESSYNTETINEDEPSLSGVGTVTWVTGDTSTIIGSGTIQKYEEGIRGDVIDKTGERGDGDKSFIGLLDVEFKIPNSRHKETPSGNLISGAEMFFHLLQKDYNSQNLENIMRYILYKYTGHSYGVDEFNFNMFDSKKFSDINRKGSSSQLLKDYIHYWEAGGKAKTNADGTKYIILDDGAGNLAVGYGVDIENSGYKQAFIDAGYPIHEGGEVPVEFVDGIEEMIIKSKQDSIEAAVSGLDLTKYQINALISRAYNCGASGAVETRRGSPALNFANSYNAYWNEETDDLFDKRDSNANYNHKLYTNYMSKPTTAGGKYLSGLERRRRSEWVLFQTGYYDVLNSWHADIADFSVDIVQSGEYAFPQYLQNNYPGSYGTSTIPQSGCGPTSLAMVLAGLKNDASIDPYTVVENISKNWSSGGYYIKGVGSSHCIFDNSFLQKYYGVSSKYVSSQAEALTALENGYPVIGNEDGHILAIIPAPEEYKSQGYKFYILDSARGHGGPYKSVEDANRVVRGNLNFISIIKP